MASLQYLIQYLKEFVDCNRRNSFLSFGGPQLYYLEALPFTYDQYVVIELSDKLYNCYCLFLCEPMNFHPENQFFQVPGIEPLTLGLQG